jgi:hypothetical protein
MLFIASRDGLLYAFGLQTSTSYIQWKFFLSDLILDFESLMFMLLLLAVEEVDVILIRNLTHVYWNSIAVLDLSYGCNFRIAFHIYFSSFTFNYSLIAYDFSLLMSSLVYLPSLYKFTIFTQIPTFIYAYCKTMVAKGVDRKEWLDEKYYCS